MDLKSNRIVSLERQSAPCPSKDDVILWQNEKLPQLKEHGAALSSQDVDTSLDTEVQCPQCHVLVANISALKTHFAV